MSVLTRSEILKEIGKKNIKIEPLEKSNIGAASVDLTLGNEFRIFRHRKKPVDVKEDTDYEDITRLVREDSIVVKPGETVLGITIEKITLAPDIVGWLEGRSRFARLGLMVHASSGFIQPGVSNKQVLEISNSGSIPLRIHAETRICQVIFQRTLGRAKYEGRFSRQVHV